MPLFLLKCIFLDLCLKIAHTVMIHVISVNKIMTYRSKYLSDLFLPVYNVILKPVHTIYEATILLDSTAFEHIVREA